MTVPTQYNFEEPHTLREAEDRRILLLEQFQDIETQLGETDKADPSTGERLRGERFQSWRRKARFALKIKKAEYAYLGRWIKRYKEEQRDIAIMRAVADPFSADGLLLAAFKIFKRSFVEGISSCISNEQDQAVIDAIHDYLQGREKPRERKLRESIDNAMPLILNTFPVDEYPMISELVINSGWASGEPEYVENNQ